MIFGFGPQNPVGVLVENGGGIWHDLEAWVVVGCTDQDLDHFSLGVKWFS